VIDCFVCVGAAVLVFRDGNSNEKVDYGGRFYCAAILQHVEGV
jgi:hypothetical protein